MALLTTLYFTENVDVDQLFTRLQTLTKTEGCTFSEQIINDNTQFLWDVVTDDFNVQVTMTFAVLGKLVEGDLYDEDDYIQSSECWVQAMIITGTAPMSLAETHASYLMSLASQGYKFRWKNMYDNRIYSHDNFEALSQFCVDGEIIEEYQTLTVSDFLS